ncbi:hypothetical protein OIE73_30105 [Streptomyces hirsutus]|uniref:Uncharacterized protein n=1 Tax=Streptomyces hirsutus TaxID=35620 RepID=A0ABZ1GTT1_9ACTN|nr:hypothetical protein [Streptomyces hirsutus]WSD09577.1 hypothetical protein OIE73_30105 [Streptomyces hirsutus]
MARPRAVPAARRQHEPCRRKGASPAVVTTGGEAIGTYEPHRPKAGGREAISANEDERLLQVRLA